jgi:flavin reductase (DIM6/NTAB) family NADH-FMN oxidoreductase RutF
VPRPIALATTISRDGVVNAAPFSFFNCLSADPGILALGVEYRASGDPKDTGRNARETGAFTVNIVNMAMMDAMNVCAMPFEPEINELQAAGLVAMPGAKVPCPWIAQAPAAFECRHHSTLTISHSREIILGEIVHAHFHDGVINRENFHIDPAALDAVGRMGGHGYATTRDYFDLPTLSLSEWQARQSGGPRG